MATTLALSIGVPIAMALIWFGNRRGWSRLAADARGIALQTVIVIVVMLVIAGGVAGVLLSRGGDVIGDLESAETASINAANCASFTLRDTSGDDIAGVSGTSCVFTTSAVGENFSRAACVAYGGVSVAGTAGAAGTCTVTY